MKLLDYFRYFLEQTVNLNQSRIDTLDQRVETITRFLEADPELGSLVLDVIAQGFYAHKTIIKPPNGRDFDADVLLAIAEQSDWEPKDYIPKVYAAFRRSQIYKELVDRKTRCVTVDYANDFHIDLVPYVERAGDHWVTNRHENRFERTNPEGFNAWLDEKNRITKGRLVEVIRLMKYLRDFKGTFSVKSVILTTLLGERVNYMNLVADVKYYADLPTALYHIVRDLDDYLQHNPTVPMLTDPSCSTENFNHRWDQDGYASFREKIHFYAGKIGAAYEEPNKGDSLALWQEVFGDGFQKPLPEPVAEVTLAKAPSADNEQFLGRDLGIPIDSTRYRLRIVGRTEKKDGFRDYDLSRRGNRIMKHRGLSFRVANCDVPAPYKVYWKIKNTGKEAIEANCLRGEIVPDEGKQQHYERTLYRGSHYVECYVVKDGRCVAQDRQRVVIE